MPQAWKTVRILRSFWRKHIRHSWRDYRWVVLGGLWLATLVLGYIGFARHAATTGQPRSLWDLFYLALQLFPLQSGAVPPPVPWELEVARLLAPAIAAYTALQALAAIFYERLQSFRLRFIKDHVVVCGLGRTGWLLASGLLERGERVVAIEQDEHNDFIQPCREQGATVLIGDATRREMLRQAGVHKARHLVSVCGDGANAEIAVHARALVGARGGQALTCFVQIVEPQLCNLIWIC